MFESRFKGALTVLLLLACFGLNNCAPNGRKSNHKFYENVGMNEVSGFEDEGSENKVRLMACGGHSFFFNVV